MNVSNADQGTGTKTWDPSDITPERRQDLAVAALAAPVVRHRGMKVAKAMQDREEAAVALAAIEGYDDAQRWANDAFKPKGVRRAQA